LTWPHPTQTPYSRFSVPAYCYHYLIGYDTNFHVSVRPRMYLSTTISLSVILRLLNSKTCKICKQKNSQQKKIYCIIQKKICWRTIPCVYTLTHPYKSPKKILPLCRFFEIWRNSLLLSNWLWFIFSPLTPYSNLYHQNPAVTSAIYQLLCNWQSMLYQGRRCQVRWGSKKQTKNVSFYLRDDQNLNFWSWKNLTTDFFPQKCHSWLYSEETDFYKKTVIFWLEKKRS